MSVRPPAPESQQPESFAFSQENGPAAEAIMAKSSSGMTGANGSSVRIRASGEIFCSTVGSKKLPPMAWRLPPVRVVAPFAMAS